MGEMITIPMEEYRRLHAAVADLEDLRAFDRVRGNLAAGREELLPAEFVQRIIAGEAPLRAWRQFRQLTQAALAAAAGVNRVQIADIEAGRKSGSIDTLRKLADALGVGTDDLI